MRKIIKDFDTIHFIYFMIISTILIGFIGLGDIWMELATIINTIIVAYAMYVIIDTLEGKNTIKSIVSMLSSFIASIAITICGGIVLILLNNRYIILVYQLMCLICIVVIACKIMRKE